MRSTIPATLAAALVVVALTACGDDSTASDAPESTEEACRNVRAGNGAADRGNPDQTVLEYAKDAAEAGRLSDDGGLRGDSEALLEAGAAGDRETMAVALIGMAMACTRLGL